MLISLSRIVVQYPHFLASLARRSAIVASRPLFSRKTGATQPENLTLSTVAQQQQENSTQLDSLSDTTNFVLPVLDAIVEEERQQKNPANLENIIFVCGQHLLLTTVSLVQALITLGAKPENIFMVGKSYSNNSQVIQELKKIGINYQPNSRQMALGGFATAYNFDNFKMWTAALEHIQKLKKDHQPIDGMIALDDGGHVLMNMPAETQTLCERIVGIEQTSSGVNSAQTLMYPTIEVATAALKQIEPPMVAEIVARKLSEKLDAINKDNEKSKNFSIHADPTVGVAGLGHIGRKVLLRLIHRGYRKIAVFDKKVSVVEWAEGLRKEYPDLKIYAAEDLRDCIWSADILIGCTGTDITAGRLNVFQGKQRPMLLLSCSSKDIEFQTLLNYIQKARKGSLRNDQIDPLQDIDFQNGFQSPIKIIRGGMPINFDNSLHSVPPEDIQLIRGLKLVAVLQAYNLIQEWKAKGTIKAENYMVDPRKQQQVLTLWQKLRPKNNLFSADDNHPLNLEAIIKNSGGVLYSSPEAPELEAKFRPLL